MSFSDASTLGWRPHVVYELIDVNRQTLVYWRDCVYPQNDQKFFSTYEILIFAIIKIYAKQYGIQISRLKKVDWHSILMEIQNLTFSGHKDVVLNIDMRDHSYHIFKKTNELTFNNGYNNVVNVENISKELVNKLLDYGCRNSGNTLPKKMAIK